jgi:predicted flap endonuclease-1-like 5' DNA nuclease
VPGQVKEVASKPLQPLSPSSKQVENKVTSVTETFTSQIPRPDAVPSSTPSQSSQDGNVAREASATDDSLSHIPGMEPEVQHGLEKQGIMKISQLLAQSASKDSRAELAQNARIPVHQLKTLIDRADLMRLQGVEGDEATLLEEAGVAGCKDLQHRNSEHLYTTLIEGHARGLSSSPPPTLDQLTQWIAEAKILGATSRRPNK